jgi:hypothetical protein
MFTDHGLHPTNLASRVDTHLHAPATQLIDDLTGAEPRVPVPLRQDFPVPLLVEAPGRGDLSGERFGRERDAQVTSVLREFGHASRQNPWRVPVRRCTFVGCGPLVVSRSIRTTLALLPRSSGTT